MKSALLGLVAVLALASCKTQSLYTKGPPRRVVIDKQASTPTILAEGVRDADGGVVIRVLELREVRVTRRTQHASLETRVLHPGHPLWELVEIPLALAGGVTAPALFLVDFENDERALKPGEKRDSLRMLLALLNPFRSVFSERRRVYVSDQVTFDGKPTLRQYNVRLPIGEAALRYRVLDAGRDELASGEITTDPFGKLRIADVPPEAVGIELVGTGINVIAAISAP